MFQSKRRKKRNGIIQHIEFVVLSTISCGIGYLVLKEDDTSLATVIICTIFIIFVAWIAIYVAGGEDE